MKVPRKKRPGRVLAFEEKSTEIEMYKTTETLWKKAHWQLIQERWEALMKRRTTAGSHTNGCMVEYSACIFSFLWPLNSLFDRPLDG